MPFVISLGLSFSSCSSSASYQFFRNTALALSDPVGCILPDAWASGEGD